MKLFLIFGAVLFASTSGLKAAPVIGQGTWDTSLLSRDFNGDGLIDGFYDTALKITWLANANFGAGSSFDDSPYRTGNMSWAAATLWASSLIINNTTGWRLPNLTITNSQIQNAASDRGFNLILENSEIAHLYYHTLGNNQGQYMTNTGPFTNLRTGAWWTSAEYAQNDAYAWAFFTYANIAGMQDWTGKLTGRDGPYAWGVHDGDILAVNEPESICLVVAGIIALIASKKRKRASIK